MGEGESQSPMIVMMLGLLACCGLSTCAGAAWYLYIGGYLFGPSGASVAGSAPGTCDHKEKQAGWEYTVRTQNESKQWTCPTGWDENYCTWTDGTDIGKLQCRRSQGGESTSSLAKPCEHKTKQSNYMYKRRVQNSSGAWVCPPQYFENYCSWSDGAVAGELQCRRKKVVAA